MGRGRGWTAVLAMVACAVLISTVDLAEQGKGKGGEKGKQAGHRRARGQRMRSMGSEAMRAEFEKFQVNMKAFKEEANTFREKVKKAVQAAHQGEGKPTREMVQEALAQYKDEAKSIATKIVGERIRHNEAVVSILKSEKNEMIDRITKRLLIPHGGPGGGKNLRRKGEGRGSEGRKRGGNVKIDPAGYDVKIDVPE